MARQVGPKNVVGRDKLIELIWKKLDTRSLRFTAERRVGKTTVMTKMAAEPKAGYEVLFMDLEGIDSPTRFVELVINRALPLLPATGRMKKWWDDFRNATGGTEIGGVIKLPVVNKVSWQDMLTKTLEGLCEHQSDKKILLIFDELPYMLQKIASVNNKGVRYRFGTHPPLGRVKKPISLSPWEGREERPGRASSYSSIYREPSGANGPIRCRPPRFVVPPQRPSLGEGEETYLTLAMRGSRGTSREGLLLQLNLPRTIRRQRANTVTPSPLRRSSSATLPGGG